MSGVIQELLVSQGPSFRFPSEVRHVRFVDTIKGVAELVVALCSLHRICTDGAILVTEQDNVARCVERVGLRDEECA